jgi:ATPase subunit of ABC transporter with duplicated ATPase domains
MPFLCRDGDEIGVWKVPDMSLITAAGLGKSFGPVDIFSRISLSIPHRSRIAIVGPNGIGKTTLLRILAGEDTPSAGHVSQARSLRIGYLPQEAGNATHPVGRCDAIAELRTQEANLPPEAAMSSLSRRNRSTALWRHKQSSSIAGIYRLTRIQPDGLGFSGEYHTRRRTSPEDSHRAPAGAFAVDGT